MDEKLIEAILEITGGPNWDVLKESLENDLENYKSQIRYAESWDKVNQIRGMMEATEIFSNMREIAKAEKANAVRL